MQYGLIEKDKIILKKEKDFLDEDRNKIEEAIKNTIINFIENILDEKNIKLNHIELIGISAPRKN